MSVRNTLIKFKRTLVNIENFKKDDSVEAKEELQLGEPLIIDNTEYDTNNKCSFYLAVGSTSAPTDTSGGNSRNRFVKVGNAPIFKAFKSFDKADSIVYKSTDNYIVDETDQEVSTKRITAEVVSDTDDINNKSKYYLLSQADDNNEHVTKFKIADKDATGSEVGIYIDNQAVLHGAAWNDYAEHRECDINVPGTVVCENGDGTLSMSSERLQALPYIISDTYGMIIGNESMPSAPVAVAGRALVRVNCEVKVGDCLCADKDGYATTMTRPEVANYPDRIIGIVSEIPKYSTWENIAVNGRVWVKVV